MIEYTKTKADLQHRIRDLAWMNGRWFAILAICVLPFSAYHLLVGVAVPEALKLGFQSLTLAAVLFAFYFECKFYSRDKKVLCITLS